MKETDGAPVTARRSSAFILSAPQVSSFPAGTRIDGVEAPTKLSKGIIIDKGIEYISVLKDERQRLQQKLAVAEQLLSEIPNAASLYEARLAHAGIRRRTPSPTDSNGGGTSKRKVALAFFGGAGLFAAGSSMSSTLSSSESNATGDVLAGASHLAKRAAFSTATGASSSLPPTYSLGWLALSAWGIVFAYFIGSWLAKCSSSKQTPPYVPLNAREDALRTLQSEGCGSASPSDWRHQSTIAKAHRLRAALLVVSNAAGYGSKLCGLAGLLGQSLRGYLQGFFEITPLDILNPDTAEELVALVRLTELESAMGGFCSDTLSTVLHV